MTPKLDLDDKLKEKVTLPLWAPVVAFLLGVLLGWLILP